MDSQKIINFLDILQPSKFRTKSSNWVNDECCGKDNPDSEIKFKTAVSLSLYDCHNASIRKK